VLRCAETHGPVGQGMGGGASSYLDLFLTIDFCLCGVILNLKAFCFGAIPDMSMYA
jgi:hypothetical protein